tara:strand:- start:57 stop:218 length:162 start_codon:yes stop_codon:yes gene_type:complete
MKRLLIFLFIISFNIFSQETDGDVVSDDIDYCPTVANGSSPFEFFLDSCRLLN